MQRPWSSATAAPISSWLSRGLNAVDGYENVVAAIVIDGAIDGAVVQKGDAIARSSSLRNGDAGRPIITFVIEPRTQAPAQGNASGRINSRELSGFLSL